MKLFKIDSPTIDKVDVNYFAELAPMDRQVEPSSHRTISAVASLGKNYDAIDVLADALYGVYVPAGTYAVRLIVEGIEWLKFMAVTGNMAIELATPEFALLQNKPYASANYVDIPAGTQALPV